MPLPSGLLEYHERVNPDQPFYFPEVQGGSFDGWGPFSPGYDACYALTNPEFIQVFNHHIWANNAKLMSVYMTYGYVDTSLLSSYSDPQFLEEHLGEVSRFPVSTQAMIMVQLYERIENSQLNTMS
jgi:hypothetical protein